MKTLLLSLFVIISLNVHAQAEDLTTNQSPIYWNASAWGAGFGHKLYSLDPGYRTDLRFAVRNNSTIWTDLMTLTSDGKIGIGTESPISKLDVKGDIRANYLHVGDVNANSKSDIVIKAAYSYDGSAQQRSARLELGGNEVKGDPYYGKVWSVESLSKSTWANGPDFRINLGTANFMSMLYNGNVGIGTESPIYKLDVNGTARFGASALIGTAIPTGYYMDTHNGAYRAPNIEGNRGYYFQSYNGANTSMYVGLHGDFSGNVGIGTETPISKLDVKGGIRANYLQVGDVNANSKSDIVIKAAYSYDGSAQQRSARLELGGNEVKGDLYYGKVWSVESLSKSTWANGPDFFINLGTTTYMSILNSGNVGIGVTNPDQKLVVDGTIRAEEVKVEIINASSLNVDGQIYADQIKVKANGNTADFVFADDYQLKDLAEVDAFIKQNNHLPDVPSAQAMEADGVNLAEMNKILLQKVEELTLYMIEQQKGLIEQQNILIEQQKGMVKQQAEIEALKAQVANSNKSE